MSLFVIALSPCLAVQNCTLAWDASSDATGYRLRYGTTSGNLGQSIDAGPSTTWTISNLNDATIYYFTVAAYNAAGESQPSNQISYTTPTPSPSGAFVNGDRVVALQGVAARNTASTGGTILQVHSAGELGTVIGGPTSANGCTWWNINYDTGSDGWSTQEGYLAKATGPGATAGSGSITREVWTGISGPTVANIPVGAAPSLTDTRPSFEAPTDWADGYGTRMRGYITAPVTGNYTFWIARHNKVSAIMWRRCKRKATVETTLRWAGPKPGESTFAPSEVIPGSVLSPFNGTQSP